MNKRNYYTCAIITAAGNSCRMNCGMNKNYLPLDNNYALTYTLRAFEECSVINEIVVVCKKGEEHIAQAAAKEAFLTKPITYAEGGSTRQQSVYNGLVSVPNQTTHVAIHDGARILVTPEIIKSVVQKSFISGAAAPASKPKDTCAFALSSNGDTLLGAITDRDKLLLIQTPQCFEYNLILKAHKRAISEHYQATDDTSLAIYDNNKVSIVLTDTINTKLTNPDDLFIAKSVLSYRKAAQTKEG